MTDKWSFEDFLSQYSNEGTLNLYRSTLRNYFKLFYPELKKHDIRTIDKELVEISLQYFKQDKDFRKDLMRYRKHISANTPKTIVTKLAVLIRYFEKSGFSFRGCFIEVDFDSWKNRWTMESEYPPRLTVN